MHKLYRNILSNRYFFHNILLLITNVLAGIFSYLLHPALGQLMGIQKYGQVAALIALTLVLTTPTQIISMVAAKYASSFYAAEDHARLNDFVRHLTVVLLIVGAGVTVVIASVSGYISSFLHLDTPQGVILLSLLFVVEFATPLNMGVLQGQQNFRWYATITFLSAFLRLVFAVGFVLVGWGVNGAIIGIVASTVLLYLISFIPLRKTLSGPRTPTGSLRSLWVYSILAVVAAGGIVVLSTLDTVLATHFLAPREAGLYAALATIGRTVLFVTSSVGMVMFPRVVALHEGGKPHSKLAWQAILGVLLLSTAAELPFCVAPTLVTRALFGSAFTAISGQLALYGLAMLLLAMAQVVMTYFLATGNRSFVPIILLACALQALLITWYHADIAQLVQAVTITNGVLVLALFCMMLLRSRSGLLASTLAALKGSSLQRWLA